MRNKNVKFAGFLILIVIGISSCKKKKKNTEPNLIGLSSMTYAQMKPGNYWIYQRYNIDGSGETATADFDSNFVEKDTFINGNNYAKYYRAKYSNPAEYDILFLRDSSNYLVNENGERFFSSTDFTSVFSTWHLEAMPGDTVCKVERKMADSNQIITVPAGAFQTFNSTEVYSFYPAWNSFGNQRFRDTRYAKDIGIVRESFPLYASSLFHIEKRLVRYHLN